MPTPLPSRDLALRAVLRVLRPLVRWLVREGVTYPSLATALKPLFVDAARAELTRQGMKDTASALTLLSGVHRKDLRALAEASKPRARSSEDGAPRLDTVAQVVAAWLSAPAWQRRRRPRVLARSGELGFDALVASVSKDVRARAVLDEMLRLGVASETDEGIALAADGMAPRQGFDAMSEALAVNLEDHAAAAVANLAGGEGGHLDQAVYVDAIGETSVDELRAAARQAWHAAFAVVMAKAQARFDIDHADPDPDARRRRFRFGVYAFDDRMDE